MIEIEKTVKDRLARKQVMITGGLGMIGSTLAHQLIECEAEVTIVDSCIEPYGANLFNIHDIRDKVDLHFSDIRDSEAMKILVRDKDIIFNFAGQVSHNDSLDNPFLDADINYLGHLNVVENVKRHNPKALILYSGSRLQFGAIRSVPVSEDHPMNPKTPYAFNKAVAENMYKFYSDVHGIPAITFRIANPYGVRSQMKHAKYSIVNFFLRQAMEGKDITIFGDGNQIRDYIYVEDLAYAFLVASTQPEAVGQAFNVGSGIGTRFRDMVKQIVNTVGDGQIKFVDWPENYLNVETGDYITDISKIVGKTGWKPRVSLEEGIRSTFAYYQKFGHHYF